MAMVQKSHLTTFLGVSKPWFRASRRFSPTELHGRAFDLLEIDPSKDVTMVVTGCIGRNQPSALGIAKNCCLTPKNE